MSEIYGLARHPLKRLPRIATARSSQILRRCKGSVLHVCTDTPSIALTFDDGQDPNITPRVLDILRRFRAQATFFMMGEAARQHPELVQMVHQAGHCVGNHSWDHRKFPALSRLERFDQMQKTELILQPYSRKLFRPPFGDQSIASRFDAFCLGLEVIGWSAHGYDWCEPDPYAMCDALMQRVFPGSIVLLHDRLCEQELHRCPSSRESIVINRAPMLKAWNSFSIRSADDIR